jgi:hypothetical protein
MWTDFSRVETISSTQPVPPSLGKGSALIKKILVELTYQPQRLFVLKRLFIERFVAEKALEYISIFIDQFITEIALEEKYGLGSNSYLDQLEVEISRPELFGFGSNVYISGVISEVSLLDNQIDTKIYTDQIITEVCFV